MQQQLKWKGSSHSKNLLTIPSRRATPTGITLATAAKWENEGTAPAVQNGETTEQTVVNDELAVPAAP